jgi:hypothetical protein
MPFPFVNEKTGCVRASRKHVDFAGLSSESVGGVFSRLQPQQQHQQVTSHFSVGDCMERGRQVKALRCAPTAEAARTKRAGLTGSLSAPVLLRYPKKCEKEMGSQSAAQKAGFALRH